MAKSLPPPNDELTAFKIATAVFLILTTIILMATL